MKRNNFKLQKFDVYWESNAKILIPSDTLNNSFDEEGKLKETYYDMLKNLNFGKFSYLKNTQFLVKDFNCKGNFGTQNLDKGNIDLFNKREKNFRIYFQYASSELNVNLFPDLLNIFNNFKKFIREFSVLEQVQDFKPMKKPYNKNNPIVKEMLNYVNDNKRSQLSKIFLYKKKMLVRDWLYYFYWCKKCKSSIYGKTINPLRLEFSRFFNLCFNDMMELNNSIDLKKEKDKDKKSVSTISNLNNNNQMSKATEDNPNPDNINISFTGEFLIKGVYFSLNLLKNNNNDLINLKLGGIDVKLNVTKEKFIFNLGIKNITFGPNKLISGERVQISNPNSRRNNINNNNINNNSNILNQKRGSFNVKTDENSISKLIKKYNPQYEQSQKVINEAFNQLSNNSKNKIPKTNNNPNILRGKTPLNLYNNSNKPSITKNNFISSFLNINESNNPALQIIELTKEKNNYSVSQAINNFNVNKIMNRPQQSKLKSKGISIKIGNGEITQLNLLEINSKIQSYGFNISFIKPNDNNPDILKVNFGIIRLNLFQQYISSCLSIISEYQNYINQPQMKNVVKVESGLKLQKQLYTMKKYIYEYLINLSNEKKTEQIVQYINYLKQEIDTFEKLMENNNFEVNYIFSLFSKGIEVYFDYENFEWVYYNNEKGKNNILGKAILPQIDLNFKLTENLIYIKFFDFEFEINDLGKTKIFLNTIMKIMEEKLQSTKIFIEPCLIQYKIEMEKLNETNKKESTIIIDKKNETFNQIPLIKNHHKETNDNRGITKTLQDNESLDNLSNFIVQKEDENSIGLGLKLN